MLNTEEAVKVRHMRRHLFLLLICLGCFGCATDRPDLSGCYLYDWRDYTRRGGSYNLFIDKNIAPRSKVHVEQDGSTLTMRYQVFKDDVLKEHVTRRKMHKKIPWKSDHLVCRSVAGMYEFMEMGNTFWKTEVYKNDDGSFVFTRTSRDLGCTCLGTLYLGKATYTSMLPSLDCDAPPVYRAQPVTSGVIVEHVDLHNANDVIMLNYNIRLDPPYSISAWVRLEGSDSGTILSRGKGYAARLDYRLAVQDGTLIFSTLSGELTKASLRAKTEFPTNRWVFVTVTHKGTMAKLYQDGELVDVCNRLVSHSGARRTVPTAIGGRADYTYSGSAFEAVWSGSIADLTVYEQVLKPTDIETLFLKGGHRISPKKECHQTRQQPRG